MREEFNREIRKSIAEAQKIGCTSDIFIQMIERNHPVEVSKKLVLSGKGQAGFKQAMQIGRQDITVEYIMLMPKFKDLFTTQELDAASFRLKNWNTLL